jgi:hypothetical protein
MKLSTMRRSVRRRRAADAAGAADNTRREACIKVRDAYRSWATASCASRAAAFAAYEAAMKREEAAAQNYARLMKRVAHLPETHLAHQLARIPFDAEACSR